MSDFNDSIVELCTTTTTMQIDSLVDSPSKYALCCGPNLNNASQKIKNTNKYIYSKWNKNWTNFGVVGARVCACASVSNNCCAISLAMQKVCRLSLGFTIELNLIWLSSLLALELSQILNVFINYHNNNSNNNKLQHKNCPCHSTILVPTAQIFANVTATKCTRTNVA